MGKKYGKKKVRGKKQGKKVREKSTGEKVREKKYGEKGRETRLRMRTPLRGHFWQPYYLYYCTTTTIVRKNDVTEEKTRGKMTSQKERNAVGNDVIEKRNTRGKMTSLPVTSDRGHFRSGPLPVMRNGQILLKYYFVTSYILFTLFVIYKVGRKPTPYW